MDKFSGKGKGSSAGRGGSRGREVEKEPEEDEEIERPQARRASSGRGEAAKPRRKGKWANVKAEDAKVPMPPPGDYKLEITNFERLTDSGNDTLRVTFKILGIASGGAAVGTMDQDVNEDDECVVLFMISGDGARAGMSRFKSFMVTAAGFETEDDFDDFSPDGSFIDDCIDAEGEADIIGRELNGICRRGKPRKKEPEDYYRDWSWEVLPGTKPVGD